MGSRFQHLDAKPNITMFRQVVASPHLSRPPSPVDLRQRQIGSARYLGARWSPQRLVVKFSAFVVANWPCHYAWKLRVCKTEMHSHRMPTVESSLVKVYLHCVDKCIARGEELQS